MLTHEGRGSNGLSARNQEASNQKSGPGEPPRLLVQQTYCQSPLGKARVVFLQPANSQLVICPQTSFNNGKHCQKFLTRPTGQKINLDICLNNGGRADRSEHQNDKHHTLPKNLYLAKHSNVTIGKKNLCYLICNLSDLIKKISQQVTSPIG